MFITDLKNKITNVFKNSTFFQDKFGFENNIDITDDNQVLFRKNVVIKNIIFVTNIIYALIFTLISIGDPTNTSNWLLTVLLFPVTYIVNRILGKMIKKGAEDNLSQTLAMYIASFYMFLSAILIYFKLKYGEVDTVAGNYLSETGYILIYYSLLISSFYQDRKMLKNVFLWVFIAVTILHFTVTYNLVAQAGSQNIFEFLGQFFAGTQFRDILIRTILLGLFMLVLYIFVLMTTTIADERKRETEKRRNVEAEYVSTVSNTFKVAIPEITYSDDEIKETELLCKMVERLASLLSIDEDRIAEMVSYTRLHLDANVDFNSIDNIDPASRYLVVKSQAELALKLLGRLELRRKTEEILRYVLDGGNDNNFIMSAKSLQNDITSQIILICGIYISLRSMKLYKKTISHKNSVAYIEDYYKVYFDTLVYDRFVRFSSDFDKIYNEEEE